MPRLSKIGQRQRRERERVWVWGLGVGRGKVRGVEFAGAGVGRRRCGLKGGLGGVWWGWWEGRGHQTEMAQEIELGLARTAVVGWWWW